MDKIIAVIRREFIERVRTRAFIISTVLGPIFFIGMAVLPALLLTRNAGVTRILVVDATTSALGERITAALARATTEGEKTRAWDVSRVPAGDRLQAVQDSLVKLTGLSARKAGADAPRVDGLLIVDDSAFTAGTLKYLGANVGSIREMADLERAIRPVIVEERLQRAGVDPGLAQSAMKGIDLTTTKVADGKLTNQSGQATFALAYFMTFLLYITLLLYGVQVMTSIVEEKSNRIVEVLASSLTPFQMMLGKVVGVGLVGLTQLSIWAAAAIAFTTYKAPVLKMLGMNAAPSSSAAAQSGFAMPSVPPELMLIFLLFFILGFLFYASAYAAVGAMCNTVQETQQAQMPVMLFIVTGLMTMFALLNDPSSSLARTLSFVPMWAPFVVPVRYSMSPVPMPELIGSIASMIVGVLAMVWLAGRIYRVGILSYGKRASVADLWRWVRTS